MSDARRRDADRDRDGWRAPRASATRSIGLMREMQDASRGEPGCLRYGFYGAVEDPDEFIAVEEWESVAALRDHFATSSLARFAAGLGELVARPPEVAIHAIGAHESRSRTSRASSNRLRPRAGGTRSAPRGHRPRRDQDPGRDRQPRRARCSARRAARRRPRAGPRTSPHEMAEALVEAAEAAGVQTDSLAGVGVGSPGDADEQTGDGLRGPQPARLGGHASRSARRSRRRSARRCGSATTSTSRPTRSSSSAPASRTTRCSASSGAPGSAAA